MASGGIRSDVLASEGVTPGEERTEPLVLTGDTAGAASWGVAWYLLRDPDDAAADAVLTVDDAITFDPDAADGPTFYVPFDTDGLEARRYWRELWRLTPTPLRLTYGDFHIID